MKICFDRNINTAYTLVPFKRGQDVIKINKNYLGLKYVMSVVDGWSNKDYIRNEKIGRDAAEYIADEFPKIFLKNKHQDIKKKADISAQIVDNNLLKIYPKHVACVGVFVFSYKNNSQKIIIALGSVNTFLWQKNGWFKPKEIGDYSLPYPQYPSDVSMFFGRGELKSDPLYLAQPDVVICDKNTPILLTTDGLNNVLNLKGLNKMAEIKKELDLQKILSKIIKEINLTNTQKDDISILISYPKTK